jgi:hypothetical protein
MQKGRQNSTLVWEDGQKEGIVEVCKSIINIPYWKDAIKEKIELVEDDQLVLMHLLTAVAKIYDLDIWPKYWDILQRNPLDQSHWFYVVYNASEARLKQAVDFAESVLPLEKIATGPAESFGMGKEYVLHGCLDYIVQELKRFPNMNTTLVLASLKSPVIRNRNMALNVLEARDRDSFTNDIKTALIHAAEVEPVEDVKERIMKLL